MLIVMKPGATEAQVEEVLKVIRGLGFKPHPSEVFPNLPVVGWQREVPLFGCRLE